MSEPDMIHKLASNALEMSDQMSAEQLRLYHEFITKKYEMKVAEEAFMAATHVEGNEDKRIGETLWSIRRILEDKKYRLSGMESVMLASYHKRLEGDEDMDTKRLNLFLQSFDRKPANTTKLVDTLAKKRYMETHSDGMHSHKTFSLTASGQSQTANLLTDIDSGESHDRLAVVD